MSHAILALRALSPVLLLALARPALAEEPPAEGGFVTAEAKAEAQRLSDDLEKLAKRQVWTGVEKKYRDLVAIGVPLEQQDYLYGAYAARELGDVAAAYERLQAAARLGGSKEIVDWLWDIDHNYGNVDLLMVPPRSVELACDEMPMDPNQRKAVEAAMRKAKEEGSYSGLLPKGSYTFAGQPFVAEPGVSVRIEVNPKVRKKGPAPPLIRYPQAPPTQGGTSTTAAGSSSVGASSAPPAEPPPTEPPPADPEPEGSDSPQE